MKKIYDFSEFITVKELKNYYEIDENSISDENLKAIIELAGNYVQLYCNLPILKEIITKDLQGSGTDTLMLFCEPVIISEVLEIDSRGYKSIIALDDIIYNQELQLIKYVNSGIFDPSAFYRISFVSGEISLPILIKQATLIVAVNLIKSKDYRNIKIFKADVISITFDKEKSEVIPNDAKMLLSSWRNDTFVV